MYILHIDTNENVSKINTMIKQGKDVFVLVYMEGCGPCNATRPEWAKIESALKDQYAKNDKLVVVDVNKDVMQGIKHIGSIDGFPTMKYIGNYGKTVEPYENSSIKKKDRSVSSFINWIESKINKMVSTTPTSSVKDVYKRISKQNYVYKKTYRKKSKTHCKYRKGCKKTRKQKSL